MLLDELMLAYQEGEPLSSEQTAYLAETLIGSMQDGGDAALMLGFGKNQLRSYFIALRNAHIGAAWFKLNGDMNEMQRLVKSLYRLSSVNNEAVEHLLAAKDLGLGMPESTSSLYEIINGLNEQQEQENGRTSEQRI